MVKLAQALFFTPVGVTLNGINVISSSREDRGPFTTPQQSCQPHGWGLRASGHDIISLFIRQIYTRVGRRLFCPTGSPFCCAFFSIRRRRVLFDNEKESGVLGRNTHREALGEGGSISTRRACGGFGQRWSPHQMVRSEKKIHSATFHMGN